jgi:ribokinase
LVKTVVAGAINWDVNLFVDRFPRKGGEVVVRQITRVPGGKAGNVAVAAARLLGPSQASIFGAVGRDYVGSEQVRIFKEEGVDVRGLKTVETVESGHAYIVIDERGENIIHTYSGANATITRADLDDPLRQQIIAGSSVVTIMDPPFETSLKLAKDAHKLEKLIAWDPGVKSRMGIGSFKRFLETVDYLVVNESEMEQLTGKRNRSSAVRSLMKISKRLKVVAKLGASGSIMYSGREKFVSPALDLKSLGMKVVNTVGCGDAFLGAFVAALVEGRTDYEALKWGTCAGGLKATRAETRGGPDKKTLLSYVR